MAGPRLEGGSPCVGSGFKGCCVGGFGGEGEFLAEGLGDRSWRGIGRGRGVVEELDLVSFGGFEAPFDMVASESTPKEVSVQEFVLL